MITVGICGAKPIRLGQPVYLGTDGKYYPIISPRPYSWYGPDDDSFDGDLDDPDATPITVPADDLPPVDHGDPVG